MKTGAIILAAGMSSRMGRFKPLLEVGSTTAIRRIIATIQSAGAAPVVFVTGYQAELLEAHVSGLGVVCRRNEKYESSQMLDSIKIGLRYIMGVCEQVLVTPTDVPLFSEATVRKLSALGAGAAIPVYGGRSGHPMLISGNLFTAVESYDGDGGLAGAIKAAGCPIERLEVEDEGILLGMNTPEEYKRLLDRMASLPLE